MNGRYSVLMVFVMSLLASSLSYSQFKRTADDEPKVSDSFIRPETDADLLSFFNPDNFKMRQSFSMSYMTMAGQGLSLGMYTNSMMYKLSSKVDVQADVSLQSSPYSSLASAFRAV